MEGADRLDAFLGRLDWTRTPGMAARSVMAGMMISVGGAMMTLVRGDQALSGATSAILSGLAFSVGLLMVTCWGADLFTGDCLLFMGVRSGACGLSRTVSHLARSWVGNLVGSMLMALLLWAAGVRPDGAFEVASAKCALSPLVAFMRGVGCNVLVCLAVWICAGERGACGKAVVSAALVASFVALGLEHSVANMFLIPFGLMCGAASPTLIVGALVNLATVTAGNLVGGMLVSRLTLDGVVS